MIAAGFLLFVLFLGAIPFLGAVCFKFRPERLFAAGLLANALLFYVACAVNLCNAGVYVILAGNLALYVPAAAALRKERRALREFLTPGVIVFYMMLALAFLTAVFEHPLWWDEFSHWCSSAKFLFEYGTLNCAQGGLLHHASYPPGLPVLDTLVHKCFVGMPFRDFMPRFAIRTALLTLFTLPLGDMRRAPFRECLAAMLVLFLVAVVRGAAWTCESDCILGCLFAAAVYVVMRHDRSVRDDLLLALLLAWLVLVKKAGTGFAVMTLVLYVVRWIADRKSGETPKRPVWSFLVVLGAPFLVLASWSLLLKLHQTPIVFPVGKITPGGIRRLVFYGDPARGREIGRLFVESLRGELSVFAVAALLLVVCLRVGDDRVRRKGDLCWFLPLALAVYLASLFLTYVYIFTPDEAYRMASFSRYLNGFMLMPLIALAMLLFTGTLRERLPYRPVVAYAVIALVSIRLGALYYVANFCGNRVTRRWPEERAALAARFGGVLRAPEERFAVVSSRGGGLYFHMFRNEFAHRFVGEALLLPAEPGRPQEPTPDELRRRFLELGARHVLVLHPYEALARDYAALWESPPELETDYTIFEVTPEGRLRPLRRPAEGGTSPKEGK